ncbi:MAG: Gfo/Idh/MocA family protein [Planctomycetaceae bacterium]
MIRLGLFDFDSSHSIEFTRRLNHVGVDRDQCVDGARVVLGCPGASRIAPERIAGFTRDIETCGVELVERPGEMLGRIDAALVLSLAGDAHLEGVRPFLEAGIPAYVDKPFACRWADASEMIELAAQHGTMVFSSSALRFAEEVRDFQEDTTRYGAMHGCVSYGPAKRDAGNPGLFHYGIHAVELLFALMGRGCTEVATVSTDAAETVTARWSDGRTAVLRGNRAGSTAYGFLAFCEAGVIHQPVSARYAYRNLLREIVRAFETAAPAVDPLDTLEIVSFILASLESERRDGGAVRLDHDSPASPRAAET